MTEKTFDRVLAQCLEEVERTGDIERVLEEHPEHATQVRAFVELARYVQRSYADVPEPPNGLAPGRERLLREARRDSVNITFPLIFMIFPTIQDDARYREGLAHLQAGELQEAMACLQELLQEYPSSQESAQTVEHVPFVEQVEGEVWVEPQRRRISWRPWVYGGLILTIVISLSLHVVRFVREGTILGVPSTEAALQRADWLLEGQEYLEEGRLDAAQARFAAVLSQQPGNQEALRGLAQVSQQRLVQDLYEQAVARQAAGDYVQALELLIEVSERSPGYRDVPGRIATMEQEKRLDALFAEAEAAYAAGRTAEALAAYERVRQTDVSYRPSLLDARLFELHMELGRALVATEPPAGEGEPGAQVLAQAIRHFAQAMDLRPGSAEAAGERQLATACAQGLNAYHEARWDTAKGRLREVFEERPGYLGGAVAEILYQAYLGSAERYEQAEELQLAYQEYQRAIELPVDTQLARERAASLAPRLTPEAP